MYVYFPVTGFHPGQPKRARGWSCWCCWNLCERSISWVDLCSWSSTYAYMHIHIYIAIVRMGANWEYMLCLTTGWTQEHGAVVAIPALGFYLSTANTLNTNLHKTDKKGHFSLVEIFPHITCFWFFFLNHIFPCRLIVCLWNMNIHVQERSGLLYCFPLLSEPKGCLFLWTTVE